MNNNKEQFGVVRIVLLCLYRNTVYVSLSSGLTVATIIRRFAFCPLIGKYSFWDTCDGRRPQL